MTDPLPNEGNVTLEQLRETVGHAKEMLGVPDSVEVLSILAPANGPPANAATVIRVGFGDPPPSRLRETMRLGSVTLVRTADRASTITSASDLLSLFTAWAEGLSVDLTFDPQFPTSIYRRASSNDWDAGPCWTLGLHDRGSPSQWPAPNGPFYDSASRFFAESFGAAAFQWLHDPRVQEITTVANQYLMVIRDQRAFISRVYRTTKDTDSKEIHIGVEISSGLASSPPVDVAMVATDFDGQKQRIAARFDREAVSLPLRLPAKSLQIVLFARDTGSWLDQLHDGGRGPSSLVAPPAEVLQPAYRQLLADVERGECDTVEFKPFISLDRGNRKSYEILK